MVAELKPARRGWVKGRAMGRNLMLHAKLLMLAVGLVEASRRLHLPLWSWLDPALEDWSRLIVLGLGVLVAWNVRALLDGAQGRAAMRAKERELRWVKDMASLYPPPLAQPGNSIQGMALQAAMAQGQVSMAARPGQPSRLRYMLPPLITMTGPQPKAIGGACGKCGQPMSAHLYYGRGECCYQPQAVVHVRACKACGDLMLLGEHERDVIYCGPCGPQGI